MNRRRFLEITGLAAAAAAVQACAASVYGIADGPPDGATDGATDGAPRSDARPPSPDARTDGADASATIVVATAFTVLLEDTSCSGHNHSIRVEARSYGADEIVPYLSGSHLLHFSARLLAVLATGQRIPFSTIGPGPGHGHCGYARRNDVGPALAPITEQCVLRATSTCELRR